MDDKDVLSALLSGTEKAFGSFLEPVAAVGDLDEIQTLIQWAGTQNRAHEPLPVLLPRSQPAMKLTFCWLFHSMN